MRRSSHKPLGDMTEDIEIIGPGLRRKELIAALPSVTKLMLRLVIDRRVPLKRKLFLAAFAAYLASPIDLIPDFLPVVGHLDDVALLVFALKKLVLDTDHAILFELWDGDPTVLARILVKFRKP
ncbi:MAG: hypothetical protein C4318_09070 [Acidimicrobiia bacterium]